MGIQNMCRTFDTAQESPHLHLLLWHWA